MRVEGACASGSLAFSAAVDALRAGNDVAVVVGAEVQTTASARQGGEYLARASHFQRQSKLDDFVFPALFARRAKACLDAGVVTDEDLAALSVKAYENANKNPLAHMHSVSMDIDTALVSSAKNPNFLGNAELKAYMKASDCSQVSDGAAALVLATKEGLHKLGKLPSNCIELIGIGQATGNLYKDSDPLTMATSSAAAARAFAESNISAHDIEIAELHDCFTISEVLMMEAIGFSKKGHGAALVRSGATRIDGKLPINTGGGLVGFGHPVGATGVKQILEIFRQMKGECGTYQIPKIPTIGLAANMGGDDKTSVVTVFRNIQ